jgi:hypothetical protein
MRYSDPSEKDINIQWAVTVSDGTGLTRTTSDVLLVPIVDISVSLSAIRDLLLGDLAFMSTPEAIHATIS